MNERASELTNESINNKSLKQVARNEGCFSASSWLYCPSPYVKTLSAINNVMENNYK